MPLSLPFVSRWKTAITDIYPELRPFQRATRKRDWSELQRLFDDLPDEIDPAYAVDVVTSTKGGEGFLRKLADTERSSSLPRVFLGNLHIKLAWNARGRKYANHVNQDQFQVFFDHLQTAERLLASVTADEPENVTAWSFRLTTARGLQFGTDESRRRYEKVAAVRPHAIYAQRQMLQNLCPKWGGSLEELCSFVDECANAAPDGSLSASLPAEAVFERMGAEPAGRSKLTFLRTKTIVDLCTQVEWRTTDHPDWREMVGSMTTHGVFAYYWGFVNPAKAAPHFYALNSRMVFPWTSIGAPRDRQLFRQREQMTKRAVR